MSDEDMKNALLAGITMLFLFGTGAILTWLSISDAKWECESDLPDYVECIWSPPPSYSAPTTVKEG